MFARQNQPPPPPPSPPPSSSSNNIPPWASSHVAALSAAAASSAASASNADGGDISITSSEPAQATSLTTFTTSVSLSSTIIPIAASSSIISSMSSVTSGQYRPTMTSMPPNTPGEGFPGASQDPGAPTLPSSSSWAQLLGAPTGSRTVSPFTAASSESVTTESTPSPDSITSDHSGRKTLNGAVLAAIIVPIVLLLLLGVGVILCLRRRRQARNQGVPFQPMTQVREKIFAKRESTDATSVEVRQVGPPQPHLITSPQNNTYFTGLDTMSMMSADPQERFSDSDPPPPYWPSGGAAAARSISVRSAVSAVSAPRPAFLHLATPVSPLESQAVPEESPFADPPAAVSEMHSSRSITSTLYSSNASVIEARPARRSVGGANMVDHGENGRSPFADPNPDLDD
ncbi:hypothetical protein BDV97DRAFT_71729 [Delphinella strobiligena]|nr:hypothetical protein BDV97DRAFT_71729 [Delphinella strobiligena]